MDDATKYNHGKLFKARVIYLPSYLPNFELDRKIMEILEKEVTLDLLRR